MIDTVPTFATAHNSTCEGPLPGRQLPPSGLACGAISLRSASKACCSFSAAGPCSARAASTPTASIKRSTPIPPVSCRMMSTGSSSSKLTTSAPCARAVWRRDSIRSPAITRPALISSALAIAN